MSEYLLLKQELLQLCRKFVEERASRLEESMDSQRKALEAETKSSAGDKHETGRAMLQLEMEKTAQQYQGVQQMGAVLERMQPEIGSDVCRLGSLVRTSSGMYFISISMGSVSLEGQTIFAVSSQSPVGRQLLGSKRGDTLAFNGAVIEEIA